jgi:hypothetical protein
VSPTPVREHPVTPTILDLRRQEEEIAREEELEIKQKREAARRLAVQRGLSSGDVKRSPDNDGDVFTTVNEGTTPNPQNGIKESESVPSEPQSRTEDPAEQSEPTTPDGKDPT